MPTGVLTQHSQEPGSIPRRKQSALQAGSPARVQGRAVYLLPGPVSRTLLAGEPTGRRPERQAQATRTSVGGEVASPGRGAGPGAALPGIRRVGRRGGAPSLTPRGGRWAEQGAPAGRVPNAGLQQGGPGWQPWRGVGSEQETGGRTIQGRESGGGGIETVAPAPGSRARTSALGKFPRGARQLPPRAASPAAEGRKG